MNNSSKDRLKRWIKQSHFASHWVATLQSKMAGIYAWRYRLVHLGRCHISMSAKITGWASCQIGRNVVVGARTWINVNQRGGTAPCMVIGDNSFIGQDNFLTVGKHLSIGPYCLTASHCSFVGSTHLVDDPFQPYSTTGTSDCSSINVGTNCFFGYGAMVLGNVTIGHGCIVGAGAVVRDHVAPFSVVVGNPANVVRYFDFTTNIWRAGERSINDIESVPSEEQYSSTLKKRYPHLIQPLSAAYVVLSDI